VRLKISPGVVTSPGTSEATLELGDMEWPDEETVELEEDPITRKEASVVVGTWAPTERNGLRPFFLRNDEKSELLFIIAERLPAVF
jgi:hypothetical protein